MPTNHASAQQIAWERACPAAITGDVLWYLDAYRASMFLLHVSRADCRTLKAAYVNKDLIDQLTKAAASISAHLSEGYGRATRADRLRFLGYALGSTRESIVWYAAQCEVLLQTDFDARLELLARIRALLLGMIRSARDGGDGSTRLER